MSAPCIPPRGSHCRRLCVYIPAMVLGIVLAYYALDLIDGTTAKQDYADFANWQDGQIEFVALNCANIDTALLRTFFPCPQSWNHTSANYSHLIQQLESCYGYRQQRINTIIACEVTAPAAIQYLKSVIIIVISLVLLVIIYLFRRISSWINKCCAECAGPTSNTGTYTSTVEPDSPGDQLDLDMNEPANSQQMQPIIDSIRVATFGPSEVPLPLPPITPHVAQNASRVLPTPGEESKRLLTIPFPHPKIQNRASASLTGHNE